MIDKIILEKLFEALSVGIANKRSWVIWGAAEGE